MFKSWRIWFKSLHYMSHNITIFFVSHFFSVLISLGWSWHKRDQLMIEVTLRKQDAEWQKQRQHFPAELITSCTAFARTRFCNPLINLAVERFWSLHGKLVKSSQTLPVYLFWISLCFNQRTFWEVYQNLAIWCFQDFSTCSCWQQLIGHLVMLGHLGFIIVRGWNCKGLRTFINHQKHFVLCTFPKRKET